MKRGTHKVIFELTGQQESFSTKVGVTGDLQTSMSEDLTGHSADDYAAYDVRGTVYSRLQDPALVPQQGLKDQIESSAPRCNETDSIGVVVDFPRNEVRFYLFDHEQKEREVGKAAIPPGCTLRWAISVDYRGEGATILPWTGKAGGSTPQGTNGVIADATKVPNCIDVRAIGPLAQLIR